MPGRRDDHGSVVGPVGDRVELVVKLKLRDQRVRVSDGSRAAEVPVLDQDEGRPADLSGFGRAWTDGRPRDVADAHGRCPGRTAVARAIDGEIQRDVGVAGEGLARRAVPREDGPARRAAREGAGVDRGLEGAVHSRRYLRQRRVLVIGVPDFDIHEAARSSGDGDDTAHGGVVLGRVDDERVVRLSSRCRRCPRFRGCPPAPEAAARTLFTARPAATRRSTAAAAGPARARSACRVRSARSAGRARSVDRGGASRAAGGERRRDSDQSEEVRRSHGSERHEQVEGHG